MNIKVEIYKVRFLYNISDFLFNFSMTKFRGRLLISPLGRR
uniref:Uncharacterized protein n=1 Tax=virus sp. ctE0n6 TaxID=2827985 RepID=A0A8S5RF84_9VIRU|nr:MAG TPA: hypothetical protein [virus sp. ctE0n6]